VLPRNKASFASRALIVVAAGLAITGLNVGLHDWRTNEVTSHQAARLIDGANHGIKSTVPSTTQPKPSAFASYTVAANVPRYILIPKLSVEAIVRPLGLTVTGQLATPNNVYDTGWYVKSSMPGDPGAMVIDGHVSSWTTNGVFYGLRTLQAGDTIQVERGDGITLNYAVVRKQIYAYQKVDMSAVLSPVDASKPGLNLITCTGDVIKGTNDFSERIVVFAVQT
jgi:LPXTG-site transpeptidase (sortase) family protein